jgi:hypothetical protein
MILTPPALTAAGPAETPRTGRGSFLDAAAIDRKREGHKYQDTCLVGKMFRLAKTPRRRRARGPGFPLRRRFSHANPLL